MNRVTEIAPDVLRIPVKIGNCYIVGTRDKWTLLDAGTDGSAGKIIATAEKRFGVGARPEAIVLTHGHFDHAGSAGSLAQHWNVSIYAHRLELPYLTGRSKYPPPDPTVGGFMANMVRFLPSRNYDYTPYVRELPLSNPPGMEDWQIIDTPGHTPGHVSFYRAQDQILLAGDAFTTVNQDSLFDLVRMKPEVSLPPTYYTMDWEAAYDSVARLSELNINVVVAGHGAPMFGAAALEGLRRLSREWPQPVKGRYVNRPAKADANGVVYLPPPAPDPVKWISVGVAAAGAVGAGVLLKRRRAA